MFKEATAVADSDWVQFIANHDLRSLLVIAHIRRATRGTRSYPKAQPFIRELAGRIHLFAHNGDLPGIFESKAFQPERFNPIGEANSERVQVVAREDTARSEITLRDVGSPRQYGLSIGGQSDCGFDGMQDPNHPAGV